MSGFSKVMKEGWHPKSKDGKEESWRNDFKGINQVVSWPPWPPLGSATNSAPQAGWMGKGKEPSPDRSKHVSAPLSSLKDPASFAPPPKNVNYYGSAALPKDPPTRQGSGLSSHDQYQQDVYRQSNAVTEEQPAQKPKPPPVPYRVDTSGLSTSNLPPPPVRRLDSPSTASPGTSKPKPQLPPRLPPRNDSPSSDDAPPPAYTPTAPSPSQGYINQDATARLGNAGVSVPALGIGEAQERSGSQTSTGSSAINQLQSRFSQMRTDLGSPSSAPSPARAPRPDAEAVPAASTPGFRGRHADKIDFGKQKLGGVTSRINTFVEDRKFSAEANKRIPRPPTSATASPSSPTVEAQAQRKKAPPPPPPKRTEIRAAPAGESSSPGPPPVPVNTKPR